MLKAVHISVPLRYRAVTQCIKYNTKSTVQTQLHRQFGYLSKKSSDSNTTQSNDDSTTKQSLFKRNTTTQQTKFDLIIIGGGSGGLALSKEATILGKSVCVIDYVEPSTHGTKWGLGGTCVNVGCIPKKLMHYSSITHDWLNMSESYGWTLNSKPTFDWSTLVTNVQQYIKSLNFGYRSRLIRDKITYINAKASFIDPNTVETIDSNGNKQTLHSTHIAIAVGGRPKLPDIPGAEHCITSDDIFSLKHAPGKTLVIGAAYVALETAGFLTSFGYDTTVMARSIYLRGFDQQCANTIVEYMTRHGTKFLHQKVPVNIEKQSNGKLRVYYKPSIDTTQQPSTKGYAVTDKQTVDEPTQNEKQNVDNEQYDDYDTVFAAIGRIPAVQSLNLQSANVKLHEKSGKIIVDKQTQATTAKNIFAFGDVIHGGLELTPVAIHAGQVLAKRLYAGLSDEIMDYSNIPTTIFTPLEYSCCGVSEDDAIKQYGKDNIEIYHSYFTPLQYTLPHRDDDLCYAKIIVHKAHHAKLPDIDVNTPPVIKDYIKQHYNEKYEKILGLHFLGPDAAEVMQGYAVAMKTGKLTKSVLSQTITIHPSNSEELILASITKSSGVDPKKTGC